MERWRRTLSHSITDPAELARIFGIEASSLGDVASIYPMSITPYYLRLIRETGDPIWRQCVPDVRELDENNLVPDPLHEESLSPVPDLIHRYPDRVVFLVSSICPVYCRFCMRKRRVGCGNGANVARRYEDAIDYISGTPAVRDVILSGGDPLLLSDDELADILVRLRKIPHVEIIRIGTRVPVTLPERVTVSLCRMLRSFHPLYVNTHFNHPLEITKESGSACSRLSDAGIPLGNQTVLLKDINDTPEVMMNLMQKLLAIRVRPYYIHQMDLVRGTGHFRTTVRRGTEIMDRLRGFTSGLATPYYVIDAPGGKGKVPVLSQCVRTADGKLLLRNYLEEEIEYPELG